MTMIKRFNLSFALFLLLCDLALTNIALYLSRQLRLALDWGKYTGSNGAWLYFDPGLYIIVPLIWLVVFTVMSVYDSRRTLRAVDDLQTTTQATLVAAFVLASVAYFFFRELSRLLFVYFFFLDVFILCAWRMLLRLTFRFGKIIWPRQVRRVLIVGAGEVGQRVGEMLKEHDWTGLEVVGYLDDDPVKQGAKCANRLVLGTVDDSAAIVKAQGIQEVVVALPLRAHQRVKELVAALRSVTVQVRIVPDYFDLAYIKTGIEEFGGLPLVSLREPALDDFQRFAKRGFDLCVGSAMLLFLAPLMLLIAVLIKLDSRGSVLFKQERVGEKGKHFQMYKFRSMVPDAERRSDEVIRRDEHGRLVFKSKNDPRVTRVGKIIRRTSLDELPQLFNVLKGEMSLVGPRPEMPWVVEEYEPWQYQRFAVPQGITGWWQVHGRSDKPMHLHTDEDLYYIKHYSLLLDLFILWKTVGAVFKRKGAY
jgi:exopolysaccharide biosynthesis polyprenyl glycosylphosphotransferase